MVIKLITKSGVIVLNHVAIRLSHHSDVVVAHGQSFKLLRVQILSKNVGVLGCRLHAQQTSVMLVDGVGRRRVVDDVGLCVVVPGRVFLTWALLNLSWSIHGGFFRDGELGVRGCAIFILEGIAVDRQSIQVLKVRQQAHDVVDLVLSLQVYVEAAQNGKRRDRLDIALEVIKFDVLQIEICDRFEFR